MTFRSTPLDQMDRLFEQTRRAMLGRDDARTALGPDHGGAHVPSDGEATLTLEETADGYVARADLPGFEREDLVLRFEDGVLTIVGDVDVTDEGAEGWQRRRRHVHEQLVVPGTVREEEVEASYRNGVLEVLLPIEADTLDDAHRIDIE